MFRVPPYPSKVGCPLRVRRLLDQLVDPLEVVGHGLASVNVRHLAADAAACLLVRHQKPGSTAGRRDYTM